MSPKDFLLVSIETSTSGTSTETVHTLGRVVCAFLSLGSQKFCNFNENSCSFDWIFWNVLLSIQYLAEHCKQNILSGIAQVELPGLQALLSDDRILKNRMVSLKSLYLSDILAQPRPNTRKFLDLIPSVSFSKRTIFRSFSILLSSNDKIFRSYTARVFFKQEKFQILFRW